MIKEIPMGVATLMIGEAIEGMTRGNVMMVTMAVRKAEEMREIVIGMIVINHVMSDLIAVRTHDMLLMYQIHMVPTIQKECHLN
jgi:hypothetical protein